MRFTRFHASSNPPRLLLAVWPPLSGPCRLRKIDTRFLSRAREVRDHTKPPGCDARAPYQVVATATESRRRKLA